MKRISYSFLILFFAAQGLFAQDDVLRLTRAEISVGAFPYNGNQMAPEALLDLFSHYFNQNDKGFAPAITLSLGFYQKDVIEIGMDFVYQPTYFPHQAWDFTPPEEPAHRMSAFGFMPSLRINWLKPEDGNLEFYSGAGLGFKFVTEGEPVNITYPHGAFHFNALGLRFGKKLGGFLEFGLGNKGLVQAGLSYRP